MYGSCGIAIGLATNEANRNINYLGWGKDTIGLHGLDGNIHHGSYKEVEVADKFTTHDTVGCEVKTIKLDESTYHVVQFTKSGLKIGSPRYMVNVELYPTIGMRSQNDLVVTNLGEASFMYDTKGKITNIFPPRRSKIH